MDPFDWVFCGTIWVLILIFAAATFLLPSEGDRRIDRCIRAHAAGISLEECEQIERKP